MNRSGRTLLAAALQPGPGLVAAVQRRIDAFAEKFGRVPAAVKCLLTDCNQLTSYLRFPVEHPNLVSPATKQSEPSTNMTTEEPSRSSFAPRRGCNRAKEAIRIVEAAEKLLVSGGPALFQVKYHCDRVYAGVSGTIGAISQT